MANATDPGVFIRGGIREFCRSWPNQTEVTVPGMHFVQEDSPVLVGQALADWYGANLTVDGGTNA